MRFAIFPMVATSALRVQTHGLRLGSHPASLTRMLGLKGLQEFVFLLNNGRAGRIRTDDSFPNVVFSISCVYYLKMGTEKFIKSP